LEGGAYSEVPHNGVGFPKGDSPEDFQSNMEAFLKEGAARLEVPSPPVFSPCVMRDLAAIQEVRKVATIAQARNAPIGSALRVVKAPAN
jgi:hypothetical protein